MTHNLAKIRTCLRSLSQTNQIAASLLIVAASAPPFISSVNGIRQTLDALCGTQSLSQCHSRLETQKAREATDGEFFQKAAEARQAEAKTNNDRLSRTRLAETEWGKPYRGPFTVPFADHSIAKMPVCPFGERAAFSINLSAMDFSEPKAGIGFESPESNGYWLFDLFRQTADGKVYPRLPVTGTLTILCQPVAAGSRGKQP